MTIYQIISPWQTHPLTKRLDANGFVITVHGGRIAPDVDPGRISPEAVITGNSLLQGSATQVDAGAVIENSLCENAIIQSKAHVSDSVLTSTSQPRSCKCDTAGKYLVQGEQVKIASDTRIEQCYLVDSSVARNSVLQNNFLDNCYIGPENLISNSKIKLVLSQKKVHIEGPTEFSKAWLGRHFYIDRPGYFEGVFSTEFVILDFDEQTGRLSVCEIIDLPHVSRYGANVINSTNSGRLLRQPDGIMRDFGPQVRLWYDPLLSHEPMRFAPCCWVCPWTKIIGESAQVYDSSLKVIEDRLHTYILPFAVAGYDGDSILGMAFPGEANNGPSHKQRCGGWSFTHIPEAVIKMVTRLYDALEDNEKAKADTVVKNSLNNALCLLKYWACKLGLDLNQPREQQRGSRAKWLWDYKNLLEAHIKSDIWNFQKGQPIGWIRKDGQWQHEKLDQIRHSGLSRDDHLDVTGEDLFTVPQELQVHLENTVLAADLEETTVTQGSIHPDALINPAAVIDSTARIGPQVEIDAKAYIGPGVVLKGKTTVGKGAWLFRSIIEDSAIGQHARIVCSFIKGFSPGNCLIGDEVKLTNCKIIDSQIGARTIGVGAKVINSSLAARSTLDKFACAENVQATCPTIIGSSMKDCRINTTLMNMHSAGRVTGLIAQPVVGEADGRMIEISAIPMLGGGCQIRGKGIKENAVVLEGAFIGSNAIVESGCFIGFGSFVQGRLGPHEGLLPFTVSTQPGAENDQLGAVLSKFANIVITHFINWTYQSLPKEQAGNIVHLVNSQLVQAIKAIEFEIDLRRQRLPWEANQPWAKYKSLPFYNDQQLQEGLRAYRENLELGCWDLVYDGKTLSFANIKGQWLENNGRVRWRKREDIK